jgi:hypothetical protein
MQKFQKPFYYYISRLESVIFGHAFVRIADIRFIDGAVDKGEI